jgi:hypothetical protein
MNLGCAAVPCGLRGGMGMGHNPMQRDALNIMHCHPGGNADAMVSHTHEASS